MQNRDRRMGRREALALLSATSAALAASCAGELPASPTTPTTTGTGDTSTGGCVVTPNETIGPYPSRVDLFRSDIREGKPGIQLDLGLTVVNTANSCAALSGVNVEIWQCDATGNYSQYGSEHPTTNVRDGIFADSLNSELASMTGSPASGYAATFTIGLAA